MSLLDQASNLIVNVNLVDARWDSYHGLADGSSASSYIVEFQPAGKSVFQWGMRTNGWHRYTLSVSATGMVFQIDEQVVQTAGTGSAVRMLDLTLWSVHPGVRAGYFDDVSTSSSSSTLLPGRRGPAAPASVNLGAGPSAAARVIKPTANVRENKPIEAENDRARKDKEVPAP